MLQTNSYSLLSAILIAGVATPAFCETVLILKNGDRLTGKIVSEDTNQVVFATSWSSLTVPLSQITKRDELQTNLNVVVSNPVAATNMPPVSASPLVTNAPVAAVTNAPVAAVTNAPAAALPKPIVKAVPPVKPKGPKLWTAELQAGISLQYNQKNYENFNGAFKFNYNGPLVRSIVDYHGMYGRTEGLVSMDRMDGSLRLEYDINKNKRAYIFNAVGVGYDSVRKLDLTYDDSAGVGYKFIQMPNFALGGDIGGNYQEEFFEDTTRKTYFSLRVGETMAWKINSRVSFDQKLEYYPRLTAWGDYRIRGEGNAVLRLNESGTIFVNFSIIDIYDSSPAKDVIQNDLQFRSSVGVKF